MLLTFLAVLGALLFLLPSLKRNMFFILHACTMIGLAYWVEHHYFRVTPFVAKTFLLFLAIHFILINIFTFLAYWKDKKAAVNGEWRIPEKDLHMLELLGGWSGALLGQKLLHHKNRKRSYQTVFWLVPLIQVGFILFVLHYLGILHIL